MATPYHILITGANDLVHHMKNYVAAYLSTDHIHFQCHLYKDDTDPYQGPYTAAWAIVDYSEPDLYTFRANMHLAMNQLLTGDAPRRLLVFTNTDRFIPHAEAKGHILRYELKETYTSAYYDHGGYYPISVGTASHYNMRRLAGMSLPPYSSPIEWFDYVKFVSTRPSS